jgi:hypothetical protein
MKDEKSANQRQDDGQACALQRASCGVSKRHPESVRQTQGRIKRRELDLRRRRLDCGGSTSPETSSAGGIPTHCPDTALQQKRVADLLPKVRGFSSDVRYEPRTYQTRALIYLADRAIKRSTG